MVNQASRAILIAIIAISPLFAEFRGYDIPKNERTYLGQTSDFFCPIPSDSLFRVLVGVNAGLNGFYDNNILGDFPSVAYSNLFLTFRFLGRNQVQIDGGYYGLDNWENKMNIGLNYIYDFSIPLAGVTHIAISPGFHYLGMIKSEINHFPTGQGKTVYEADLNETVSYITYLNSVMSYQLKTRISKKFGIIEPFLSLTIYYHQEQFNQIGSYYSQNQWNYMPETTLDYDGTNFSIHVGFSLIGNKLPIFLNISFGTNPGFTKPFNSIFQSPMNLSIGYRFKQQ